MPLHSLVWWPRKLVCDVYHCVRSPQTDHTRTTIAPKWRTAHVASAALDSSEWYYCRRSANTSTAGRRLTRAKCAIGGLLSSSHRSNA